MKVFAYEHRLHTWSGSCAPWTLSRLKLGVTAAGRKSLKFCIELHIQRQEAQLPVGLWRKLPKKLLLRSGCSRLPAACQRAATTCTQLQSVQEPALELCLELICLCWQLGLQNHCDQASQQSKAWSCSTACKPGCNGFAAIPRCRIIPLYLLSRCCCMLDADSGTARWGASCLPHIRADHSTTQQQT